MASQPNEGQEAAKRPGSSGAWRSPFARSRVYDEGAAADAVRQVALPLHWSDHDYDALLQSVGDASIVLIGEASHGTHEFYRERARITKRLILEKGFKAVAWEADWPDAYNVNRYVRGLRPVPFTEQESGEAASPPARPAGGRREGARGGPQARQPPGLGQPVQPPTGGAPGEEGQDTEMTDTEDVADTVDAVDALEGFHSRFPTWMWRNADVLDFVGWLRDHNEQVPDANDKVGVYGLDLYSMYRSMDCVLAYLRATDPAAAARASRYYECFAGYSRDSQEYGYSTGMGLSRSCESDAVAVLVDLYRRRTQPRPGPGTRGKQVEAGRGGAAAGSDGTQAGGQPTGEGGKGGLTEAEALAAGLDDPDAQFAAEQNALLVVDAERYYREMFRGRVNSWNLRDTHMLNTLQALRAHLGQRGPAARAGSSAGGQGSSEQAAAPAAPPRVTKVVAWAHNSHLGDASATGMSEMGEVNVGQLARAQFGAGAVFNIGFSTYTGTVTAASQWDGPAERKRVRPGMDGSYEALFHRVGLPRFLVLLRELARPDAPAAATLQLTDAERAAALAALRPRKLQRAIGVIYKPATERASHYFYAALPSQFDAIIHIDETRAVEPLERTALWHGGEIPETYPEGL